MQWRKEEAARRGITILELQAELDAEEDKSSEEDELETIEEEKNQPAEKRDIEEPLADEEELKELEKLGMGVNENRKIKVKPDKKDDD